MIYIYAVQTTAVTAEQEYRSDFGMPSIPCYIFFFFRDFNEYKDQDMVP